MAFAKVEQDIVIERLMKLFRTVGYDGASLSQIAQATGLQKASLYHRFPTGKQAMAEAVLSYVDEWSRRNTTSVLTGSGLPVDRLKRALSSLDELYGGGQKSCLLRAFSLGSDAYLFQAQIGQLFNEWIAAFAHLARDFGFETGAARRLAESTLIRVQGSLILAQTLQQPSIFEQTLHDIEADFLSHQ